jgi:hypothetical protein
MKNATMRLPRTLAAGVALATGLLLHTPASAQVQQDAQGGRRWEQGQRQDPGQRLDRQVATLTQRLQLSSGQASQIRRILQQEEEQVQVWRQDHRDQAGGQRGGRGQGGWQQQGQDGSQRQQGQQGQRRQLPPELQAIRDRGEQQIERVLNDGQRAEYRSLREERGQRGNRQGGEGRGQREGRQDAGSDGSR